MANSICILIPFFSFFFFFFLGNLSIRKTLQPLAPYYLMNLSLRYIPFLCMHLHYHVFSCCFSFLHVYLHLNTCLFFLVDLEPFSVGMGMSMEGFFNGADDIAKAIASALTAATQGVPAEAPVPPSEPITVGKYLGQEGC